MARAAGRLLAAVTAMAGATASAVFQVDDAAAQRAAAGKAQLELLHSDQSCSARAVVELEHGCREMGDVEQSRLAVHFTNCHLAKSGLETYECTVAMSIEACTKPMVNSPASLAYTAYTHFYTHAESMCFYLQVGPFARSLDVAHAASRPLVATAGPARDSTAVYLTRPCALEIRPITLPPLPPYSLAPSSMPPRRWWILWPAPPVKPPASSVSCTRRRSRRVSSRSRF